MKRGALRRVFRGGIPRILSGSLVGQGAVLAVSPLLTRLYTPRDFAALAVFTAFATVVGGLATLSWERAVVVPRSEAQARSIVRLGMFTVGTFSSLTAVASFLLGPSVDQLFGVELFTDMWWLLPVTVTLMGIYRLLSAWLIRMHSYGKLAVRNAVLGVSQAVSTVTLGFVGVGPIGLLSGTGIGRAASLVGLVRWRRFNSNKPHSWPRLIAVAKRYRRFPLVATWSRMLNILGLQAPAVLIVAIYGALEAGLYALTVRVLATPIGIVTDAVSQYFEGTFAARVRLKDAQLASLMIKTSMRLALVAIVPTAIVVMFGPVIFAWAFGEEWRLAGEFAQIIVMFYAVQFTVSPVSRALLVMEKQFLQLTWDASRAILIGLAVLMPFALGGTLEHAIIAMAATQTLLYTVLFVVCIREARQREGHHRTIAQR